MTILQFPQRLTNDLRLAIHAACEEGDVVIAERLLTVLRRYVACPSPLPRITNRREPVAGLGGRGDARDRPATTGTPADAEAPAQQ